MLSPQKQTNALQVNKILSGIDRLCWDCTVDFINRFSKVCMTGMGCRWQAMHCHVFCVDRKSAHEVQLRCSMCSLMKCIVKHGVTVQRVCRQPHGKRIAWGKDRPTSRNANTVPSLSCFMSSQKSDVWVARVYGVADCSAVRLCHNIT